VRDPFAALLLGERTCRPTGAASRWTESNYDAPSAPRARATFGGNGNTHAATKVNRYPTEGRQALAIRLAGIEGGIECATLAPLLTALADGRARPDELARLDPHMR
jgi:hypothetical protein